jgi:hypothetical protein
MVDKSQYDTISAPMLVSGAGHDAMAMSHLTQVMFSSKAFNSILI